MGDFRRKAAAQLARWYVTNKRNLPWRHTQDAYQIWISEVILQQTKVVQGLPYFYKFVALFPTVEDLAKADQQQVLHCWQGLGYYSRARNMHFTAQLVVKEYGGHFPTTFSSLLRLKGIGPYTAAAVASFSCNEDVAVLDGNVMRVLCRLFNIEKDIAEEKTKKELQLLANNLLPVGGSAIHNQAIMELGALICTPRNPKCEVCPINEYCLALANDTIALLPVKSNKMKMKTRYFNYIVLKDDAGTFWMKKRDQADIWEGLWDFYLIETENPAPSLSNLMAEINVGAALTFLESTTQIKHQLTHQTIWATFLIFEVTQPSVDFTTENKLVAMDKEGIKSVPKPVLINKFLKSYLIF